MVDCVLKMKVNMYVRLTSRLVILPSMLQVVKISWDVRLGGSGQGGGSNAAVARECHLARLEDSLLLDFACTVSEIGIYFGS